jgi:hypothetical protein
MRDEEPIGSAFRDLQSWWHGGAALDRVENDPTLTWKSELLGAIFRQSRGYPAEKGMLLTLSDSEQIPLIDSSREWGMLPICCLTRSTGFGP